MHKIVTDQLAENIVLNFTLKFYSVLFAIVQTIDSTVPAPYIKGFS